MKKLLLVVLLTIIGMGISLYLTDLYFYGDTQGLCSFNNFFDCNQVSSSYFSSVFGIPIAIFALAGYLLVAVFCLISLGTSLKDEFLAVPWIFTILASLGSVVLLLISVLWLHTICLLCVVLYIINFALFFLLKNFSIYAKNILQLETTLKSLIVSVVINVVLVVALFYIFYYNDLAKTIIRNYRLQPVQKINIENSPYIGNPKNPIKLVVFSDFTCPHCLQFHRKIEDIYHRYYDKVVIYLKYFPMEKTCNSQVTMSSGLACLAAYMSYYSYKKGVFEKSSNLLFTFFSRKSVGHSESLLDYFREKLLSDFSYPVKENLKKKIQKDTEDAKKLGVTAIPIVFINGKKVLGNISLKNLKNILKIEIKK